MDFSVSELTLILKWMSLTILFLAVLLLIVWLLLQLIGRLTHRKASQTDLDLIGHEAKVTRAIRPPHTGRIICYAGPESVAFSASSAQKIPVGTTVLITAIDKGVARTIIKGAKEINLEQEINMEKDATAVKPKKVAKKEKVAKNTPAKDSSET
jgi:membrane protein implicated in regulation of membrane protease activity